MIKRVYLICLFSLFLYGCVSSPSGSLPSDLRIAKGKDNACGHLNGKYLLRGMPFRNGKQITLHTTSVLDVFSGCNDTSGCRVPEIRNLPESFTLDYRETNGLTLKFDILGESKRNEMHFLPSSLVCADGGLTVKVHSGLANDGAGAWTIGHQKIAVNLFRTTEGRLIAQRDEDRFDVFWFGLPVSSSEGYWIVFDEKN